MADIDVVFHVFADTLDRARRHLYKVPRQNAQSAICSGETSKMHGVRRVAHRVRQDRLGECKITHKILGKHLLAILLLHHGAPMAVMLLLVRCCGSRCTIVVDVVVVAGRHNFIRYAGVQKARSVIRVRIQFREQVHVAMQHVILSGASLENQLE